MAPSVVRFLESIHVDDFFSAGRLRLRRFADFRKADDPARRDTMEGRPLMQLTSEGMHSSIVATNPGDAYVLCATATPTAHVAKAFGTDTGIAIHDPERFAEAIGRSLPCVSFRHGPCTYADDLLVQRHADLPPFTPEAPGFDVEGWSDSFGAAIAREAVDTYFRKHLIYKNQAEYRFVWFASPALGDPFFAIAPAATAFCSRFRLVPSHSGS